LLFQFSKRTQENNFDGSTLLLPLDFGMINLMLIHVNNKPQMGEGLKTHIYNKKL